MPDANVRNLVSRNEFINSALRDPGVLRDLADGPQLHGRQSKSSFGQADSNFLNAAPRRFCNRSSLSEIALAQSYPDLRVHSKRHRAMVPLSAMWNTIAKSSSGLGRRPDRLVPAAAANVERSIEDLTHRCKRNSLNLLGYPPLGRPERFEKLRYKLVGLHEDRQGVLGGSTFEQKFIALAATVMAGLGLG